jgi:hypothetical protein
MSYYNKIFTEKILNNLQNENYTRIVNDMTKELYKL